MADPVHSGIGQLIQQPEYVYRGSTTARYAARYYRPVIFILTAAIILVTVWRYRQVSPLLTVSFIFMLLLYALTFMGRARMNGRVTERFYDPKVQLFRGQISIAGVTVMIALLEGFGQADHSLWILYVLATLIISEHNRTRTVLFTLLEVAVLYFGVSYLGWMFHQGQWYDPLVFTLAHPSWVNQVLGIWLVTFVFHYLVRNIQGRNRAVAQHQTWLKLLTEKWVATAHPDEQRRALLDCARELTGADADLWWLSVRRKRLVNATHRQPDPLLERVTVSGRPLLVTREEGPEMRLAEVEQQCCINVPDAARFLLPVQRLEDKTLVGILDLRFTKNQFDWFAWEKMLGQLLDLNDYMRLVLISNRNHDLLQWEKELATRLAAYLEVDHITDRILTDAVEEMAFDLATVSLVDRDENLIRAQKGKNARWVKESCHPLSGTDVQALVVGENRVIVNNGDLEPYLNRRIWRKYRHRHLSRIWVPIPEKPGGPVIGTIEAGFRHKNRKTIPPHLIQMLTRYAEHVGTALANAQAHVRQRTLAEALTCLHQASRKMQRSIAFYEPDQMVRLIGSLAEDLLKADLIMIYTMPHGRESLRAAYATAQGLEGRGSLRITLGDGILRWLHQNREGYYASDARHDPELMRITEEQRREGKYRTFTQRQNIKSFAGMPLLGRHDNLIGFLCINYRRRQEFYPEKRRVIELFAKQAAVALEETESHQAARTVAISQERHAFAAELHHTMSQNLYALKQYALTTDILAQKEHLPGVRETLGHVLEIISQSQEMVGDLLRDLSAPAEPDIDFVDDIRLRLSQLESQYGLTVKFEIIENATAPRQVQFYLARIAHEALNNIVRHAKCRHVTIKYRAEHNGFVSLSISDDGRGFDVDAARQNGRHGLHAMDFFAGRLNTQLVIISDAENGTLIAVHVSPPGKGELLWQRQMLQSREERAGLYAS